MAPLPCCCRFVAIMQRLMRGEVKDQADCTTGCRASPQSTALICLSFRLTR